MKRNILTIGLLILSASVFAQYESGRYYHPGNNQSDRFGYAVTDSVRNGSRWYFLRKIDLESGVYADIIARLVTGVDTMPVHSPNPNLRNGVAAIAYDRKNKRVYFTPQFTDRLSYVDLKSTRTRVVTNNFTGLLPKAEDQSNMITRMVITEDNEGYALTNDSRHLIRFSTSNNHVRDLGPLKDHPSNGVMSVHAVCSSFGGDMIADDDDNLYLITSANHVFKISIRTRIAKYLGTVNGLPAGFVTSGAAVEPDEKKIILVSAVDASDVYAFDPDRLAARKLRSWNPRFAADLAGSSILETRRDHHNHYGKGEEIFVENEDQNDKIELYPNPITDNRFTIRFKSVEIGNYKLEIIDAKGQVTMTRQINVGKGSIIPVSLPDLTAKGIYIMKLTAKDGKAICNQKILVQ